MKSKTFRATVWQRLMSFSRDKELLQPADRVLAGISGGPDSVCLLHFLSAMRRKIGIEVIACHVNHSLRGANAARDQKFVERLCEQMGVPCISVTVKVRDVADRKGLSIEHAARKARYSAFLRAANKHRCSKIAVGHHLDDNAETIILNLLRGTNPKGLLGIPVKRPLTEKSRKPLLVRPLLCATRAEVLEYARQNGLSYITDETNESEKYTRNWVRKTLLPLIESKQPRFRQHLLSMSEGLAEFMRR